MMSRQLVIDCMWWACRCGMGIDDRDLWCPQGNHAILEPLSGHRVLQRTPHSEWSGYMSAKNGACTFLCNVLVRLWAMDVCMVSLCATLRPRMYRNVSLWSCMGMTRRVTEEGHLWFVLLLPYLSKVAHRGIPAALLLSGQLQNVWRNVEHHGQLDGVVPCRVDVGEVSGQRTMGRDCS